MIGKSGLLSILQFVALIIPAFAILMQIVTSIDIDEDIEVYSLKIDEFKIFQYSLISVIGGGALILYRLLSYIENSSVIIGVILIFGSLPMTVLGIWILSGRRSFEGSSSDSLSDHLQASLGSTLRTLSSIVFVSIPPSFAIYLSSIYSNEYLSFGIFQNGWILTTHQFLSIGFLICIIKGVLTLNAGDTEIERTGGGQIGYEFGVGLLLVFLYLVFTAPLYLASIGLLYVPENIFHIGKAHPVFNIPYIWSTVVYYALLVFDFEPEE